MAIVYRDEQGFDLSPEQVDNNFREIEARVVALETTPPPTNDIVNITQSTSGSQVTIYLRDGSYYTVTLPVAHLRFRGPFLGSNAYFRNDMFFVGRALYLVLEDHVSAATFDSEAVDASDNALYENIFSPTNPQPIENVDSTLTIESAHFDNFLRCSSGSGCLITILDELEVPVPLGTEITFRQGTTGPLSLVYDDEIITVNGIEGCINGTDREGAWMMLKNVGNNTWDLTGLLAAEEVVTPDESTS